MSVVRAAGSVARARPSARARGFPLVGFVARAPALVGSWQPLGPVGSGLERGGPLRRTACFAARASVLAFVRCRPASVGGVRPASAGGVPGVRAAGALGVRAAGFVARSPPLVGTRLAQSLLWQG